MSPRRLRPCGPGTEAADRHPGTAMPFPDLHRSAARVSRPPCGVGSQGRGQAVLGQRRARVLQPVVHPATSLEPSRGSRHGGRPVVSCSAESAATTCHGGAATGAAMVPRAANPHAREPSRDLASAWTAAPRSTPSPATTVRALRVRSPRETKSLPAGPRRRAVPAVRRGRSWACPDVSRPLHAATTAWRAADALTLPPAAARPKPWATRPARRLPCTA